MKFIKFRHDDGEIETCMYKIVGYDNHDNGPTGIRVYSHRDEIKTNKLFKPQDPRFIFPEGTKILPSEINKNK